MHFDYNLSETYILDLKNFAMQDIVKVNPLMVKRGESLAAVCFGTAINGLHIVNAPSYLEAIILALKRGLSNITSKLYVHNSYDELCKMIPKDILPEDYGGNGPSTKKISEKWRECLSSEESRHIIDNFNKVASDESKRSSYKFNEEYLGMPGSFKQLSVD